MIAIHSVSVVIPARREETTIGAVLDALAEGMKACPRYEYETLVVVDQASDPTGAVAAAKGARILVNEYGKGKGNALAYGFRHARGEVFVIFDSDGSHDPRDIGRLLDALDKGAGLAVASRVLGGSDDHNVVRLFGNALFTVLFSILFGTTLMDVLNGFKAFVRDVAPIDGHRAKGFDVEIEIAARAIRKGYALAEVASHENKRAGGVMKSNAVMDGFLILWAVLKEGLAYRLWTLFHARK